MTMTISDVTIPTFVFTDEGQALAQTVADLIVRSGRVTADREGTISEDARILVDLLQAVANGKSVTAVSAHAELSVLQAADYLGVTEDRVEELIRSGEIESNLKDGVHTVPVSSLVDYDRETSRLQGAGLKLLSKQAQDLGWY